MSFLDECPLLWDVPEIIELRNLFVNAYRRPVQIEEIADLAGISVGTFPYHYNALTTWHELMNVMSSQGKLRTMVEKATEDPTISAYQQRFQNMLEDHPMISTLPPKQSSDWWQGSDNQEVLCTLFYERLMEKRSRLIDIQVSQLITARAQSVGRLILDFTGKKAHGTGFLIQPDLVLTNYHNIVHDVYGEVSAITIEFDHQNVFSGQPLVVQGNINSIVKNKENDWAVVKLKNFVDRPPIALGTPYAIGKGDHVIIIQHPLGGYKQFSIDGLSIQYVNNKVIQYLVDTQPGSSGSPVFNIQMHLIALHHAEAKLKIETTRGQETIWRNEGIHIDKVIQDLNASGIPFLCNK